MWERRPGDADFCRVRVGLGTVALSTRLMAPETKSSESVDPVSADAVKRLVTSRSAVQNLPVVIDVHGHSWISIEGAVATARGLARAMICQLAVLHSPAHVKIAAVIGNDAAEEWEWLKWLPHHRHSRSVDGAGVARMTYRSMAEVDVEDTARVVVVLDGGEVSRGAPGHGVTVVEIGAVGGPVGVDPDLCLDADRSSDHPDQLTPVAASTCARLLSRYRVGTARRVGGSERPR
jgi:S-DNA-T family DNA segregation ATPase FtsK/SpoIIIE